MAEDIEMEETVVSEDAIPAAEEKPEKSFNFLTKSVLAIEKLRVATQVRKTHLALRNERDPETDELLKRIRDLEDYADGRLAVLIQGQSAHHWFSRIKGVGKENIGKVIGLIDIHKPPTISALWKFSGYHVVDGKAPKRKKGGGKSDFNSRLRSMCWRLGTSLMKGRGKFYDYYLAQKARYMEKYLSTGVSIVPAARLPLNGDGKRYEPEGVIAEGHLHNQALRKMIKLFLACLWLVWREAENLPTRPPYPIEHQGHTHFIKPWDMVDRE